MDSEDFYEDAFAHDNQAGDNAMIDSPPIDPNLIDPAISGAAPVDNTPHEAEPVNPATLEPAPDLPPAEREAWIQKMSQVTDNPVERRLYDTRMQEADWARLVTKCVEPLLERHMSTIAHLLGTRKDVTIMTPPPTKVHSGTEYEDTIAYRNYTNCVMSTLSQEDVDRIHSARNGTGRLSVETFIEEMIVTESEISANGTGVSSKSEQTIGPFKLDFGILADDIVTGLDIVLAFIEFKFKIPAAVRTTCLESPVTQTLAPEAFKTVPPAIRLTVKQGIAQTIWYGCVLTEMAGSSDGFILGMFMLNGWFVRLHFSGTTIHVESDARAGQSSSLTEGYRALRPRGMKHTFENQSSQRSQGCTNG